MYYDHKKYIKPNNHVTFKVQTNRINKNNTNNNNNSDNNSNSIVSEYRKDIIRPQSAIVRSSYSNLSNNNNIIAKSLLKSVTPLLRSSSTFFNHEKKADDEDNKNLKKKIKPWHYTSATLYPWRDHNLSKK